MIILGPFWGKNGYFESIDVSGDFISKTYVIKHAESKYHQYVLKKYDLDQFLGQIWSFWDHNGHFLNHKIYRDLIYRTYVNKYAEYKHHIYNRDPFCTNYTHTCTSIQVYNLVMNYQNTSTSIQVPIQACIIQAQVGPKFQSEIQVVLQVVDYIQ